MKNKNIKSFGEFNENLNISDVSESKLNSPHQMMVGSQYKITEPDYDNAGEEPYVVEVVKQMKHGFILRDIEHNFTFERTFQHLMNCEIDTTYQSRI